MGNEKILHGVPKVHYGAFGGITPFLICLKAVSDYLGDELDYAYAIVASGGAFRFAWDTTTWNLGNVDIVFAYDNQERPLRQGITALGREFKMLWRTADTTKEDFKAFIKEQIDMGRPVISLGPVGPPEAGIITGYRDGGDTLLGWSVFQDWAWKAFDDEGYFITDTWWEAKDFPGIVGVMALGDIVRPRFDERQILQNAVAALEGRQEGSYAKGIAAYAALKKALLDAKEDDLTKIWEGMNVVMLCLGDVGSCLVDGRKNAHLYFKRLAQENPGQPLYAEIAAQFDIVATTFHERIEGALGGIGQSPEQIKALMQPETRRRIAEYIDVMKAADEKALALMKQLLD